MDFVFYDLETSGISPEYDQPLQFAAILTDENFVEKERLNIRCRLAPHILPSPKALAVTGISPDQLIDPSLPSLLEFTHQVAALTDKWAPSIWVGYNTIRFDEEVLRQAFYQNLLPNVYATQFHGNTRFDILTAVYATFARAPEVLSWPLDAEGRTSFKLDRLAPANGFKGHNAHDALGDVEATIHIAKKIVDGNRALWDELLGNAVKVDVQSELETFKPLELVLRFGAGEPRPYVGVFCGYSERNRASAGFFDIEAADPSDYLLATDDKLFDAVNESPKIIRAISTNKAPALLQISDPTPEMLLRAEVIAKSPEFRARVAKAMASRFKDSPDASAKSVEEQIYGQFYSNADKQLLLEFGQASWPRRQEIVSSLSDKRLRQLGNRLVAFYAPELLDEKALSRFQEYLQVKWFPASGKLVPWLTATAAREQLEQLRSEGGFPPGIVSHIDSFISDRVMSAS